MKWLCKTVLTVILFFILDNTANSQLKRICVIGSSTSAGYFDNMYPKDSSYANKLKKYYKDLGRIDTLFNIAVNGTDCYTGMPSSYVPPIGRNSPDSRYNITRAVNLVPKPDVIIVNYPSNGYDYMSFEEILFCLQTIRDSALANGIQCYITTAQPRDHFYQDRYRLKTISDSILNRFGEFAIDFWTNIAQEPEMIIKPEYALGDGVHLNPAGHTVLEQMVIEKNILDHVLAAEFLSFFVTVKNNLANIKWSVTDESDIKKYLVTKSLNGLDFTVVAAVTNIDKGFYSYEEKISSDCFFRVIAVYENGRKSFSKTEAAKVSGNSFSIGKTYFNGNKLNIEITSAVSQLMISLYDGIGKLLKQDRVIINGSQNYSILLPSIPPGTYDLLVSDARHQQTKRILKQ